MMKVIGWCTGLLVALQLLLAAYIQLGSTWRTLPPDSYLAQSVSFISETFRSIFTPSYRPSSQSEGYTYYEENGGSKTNDGQLEPAVGGSLPSYPSLRSGVVLRAASRVRLRNGPSATFPRIGWIEGGQCVVIVETEHPVKTADATSGGYFAVNRIGCAPAAGKS